MKKIKLMADYGCDPLWKQPPYGIGNIPPESLPISESLRKALHEWAFEYDRTLDLADPSTADFESQESADKFVTTGYALLSRLKSELGNAYEVDYFVNAHPKDAY